MHIKTILHKQMGTQRLLRNTAAILIVAMVPTIALASSWNPTLLVNTEAFQTIEDGDGSTNIELRFGETGSGLQLNVTTGQFEFDTGVEIQGTASGRQIHAQDLLTTSGSLVVEEGQTVFLNGIEYLFPATDDTDGFVLTTDGNGNLSWTNKTAGSLTQSSGDNRYVELSGDTMTGALTIDNEGAEPSLNVRGIASGKIISAQDTLASSGTLVVEGAATFGSTFTINGVTYTFPLGDGSASGKVLATDGFGQLSWTDSSDNQSLFETFAVSGQDNVVADSATDTINFAEGSNVTITTNATTDTITIAATDTNQQTTFTLSGDAGSDQTIAHGNTLEIAGGDEITTTASATDTVTVDITDDTIDFTELEDALEVDANTTVTLGSNNFDINATSTGEFRIFGTASGSRINADTALTSSGTLTVDGGITFRTLANCTNIETDANGVLSCNTTDYLEEAELDTESELEAQLTDVTNVFTNNDGSLADDDLSDNTTTDLDEGSNLYFTNERVDDRVAALLQAGSGITLTYDDAGGTFTVSQGFSSGAQVSLSPEYAGAVYYGDGSSNVGQLVLEYDTTNKENFYKWTSSQSSLNDYTISVRVKVPDEFSHWDGTAPIQFRYRTNAASSADNQIDVTMLDTAGSSVALTGGADLANTSWTTATITGPEGSGTYTPGQYITILITPQARTTNSGEAHVGYLNFNWSTEAK